MTNKSAREETRLSAYLGYRDAPAAIDWLESAAGFETTTRFADESGGLAHSELRMGEVAIVVFSDRSGYQRAPRKGDTCGLGLYVILADEAAVDLVYERATAAGATVVWKPEGNEWGNYRCRVEDPEGFEWTFGTYRPGLPQGW
ncbi:VOC family protein [Saccharomonospora sp. NPDC006951]